MQWLQNFNRNLNVTKSKVNQYVFFTELGFIAVLCILWLSCDTIRHNKSLWILFFSNFPAEFFIALIPHEPILFYFSKFYHPRTVSLVAIAGTVLAEMCNYTMIKYLTELPSFEQLQHNALTTKLIMLFNKASFATLLIAGFTPVPFYPFRFLVVCAHYPLLKYICAVFLSRTPRFYILAVLGHELKIPNYLLIILFIVIVIISILSALKKQNHSQNT